MQNVLLEVFISDPLSKFLLLWYNLSKLLVVGVKPEIFGTTGPTKPASELDHSSLLQLKQIINLVSGFRYVGYKEGCGRPLLKRSVKRNTHRYMVFISHLYQRNQEM